MAKDTTPGQTEQGTTERVEAALRRFQEYADAQYGSEYAALIRLPHDDFDL